MRLTRKEHHRKLRVLIRDNSDWLVNADVSDFCRPPAVSYLHDYLLPPTLPATSHDYLLPRHNKEKHPLILSTLL